jgi:hypothetical protein
MTGLAIAVVAGYLLGNKEARERTDKFLRSILNHGANMINKKGVGDNVSAIATKISTPSYQTGTENIQTPQ